MIIMFTYHIIVTSKNVVMIMVTNLPIGVLILFLYRIIYIYTHMVKNFKSAVISIALIRVIIAINNS